MIDTNHWRFQQVLRESIRYRVLRQMIEASRASSPPKTENDELNIRFLEELAPAH
jgi:hypothetical protein